MINLQLSDFEIDNATIACEDDFLEVGKHSGGPYV